jgi:hypothetical protein
MFHGNAMFKSNLLPYAYDVFSAHFNVLAVEYRGSVTDRTYYVWDGIRY